ncbi:MAG: complex I subunit 1 family protein [Bacteroidia bacterium]|nr:NADH-quinone oxidoreductase subunit H [Bacteroidia bacterium]MDW8133690.1 complex I subunit 1 family protein [Bacteroidia bacterium]
MNGWIAIVGILLYGLFIVYVERKVAAWIQDRQGPTETGPGGVAQTLADFLKLLRKQEAIPAYAVKSIFLFAPLLAIGGVIASLTWLPFLHPHGGGEYGLWLCITVASLEPAGLFLGGWASGSKYSLLGAYRLLLLLLAYELIVGLLLLTIAAHYKTLDIAYIVERQRSIWGLFQSPGLFLAGILWIGTGTMISHRAPFDLPETESELVGGALTEYSGLRFALFMLAEYTIMLLQAVWFALVFLGGGWIWGAPLLVMLQILFRWSWPRWRPDQVLSLAWRKGIPLAALACVLTILYDRW